MLLRKGVYPYEYMDSWEKFNETALPPKEAFYSNLNLEDISDEDYKHAQKIRVEFVNQLVGMLKQIINISKIIIKTLSHHM